LHPQLGKQIVEDHAVEKFMGIRIPRQPRTQLGGEFTMGSLEQRDVARIEEVDTAAEPDERTDDRSLFAMAPLRPPPRLLRRILPK
jgi:hypothetical protein